jgi:hypothetical protein
MTICYDLWDTKADCQEKGDNLRDCLPILNKIFKDENGFTHYLFSKAMFHNSKYEIPEDDYILFKKFLNGGSREYPSDGHIPTDVAANEAKEILVRIAMIAGDKKHGYCKIARKELRKYGMFGLVRGTIKLYLGQYTTRDWRRKRFTDDIDFWIFNKNLLEYVLKEKGWVKNKTTKEFEKQIKWYNSKTKQNEKSTLIASNDLEQILDFGNCSYLEGSRLKDIIKKKLQRGHDVDLSDIINVAIVNNKEKGEMNKDWIEAWNAFEEAVNLRGKRTTSNLINLCRLSYGIADYLERVCNAISRYSSSILVEENISDEQILRVCKASSHHLNYNISLTPSTTRNRIYNNLTRQKIRKKRYTKNLRNFASRVLELLNSKYEYANVRFEIEL